MSENEQDVLALMVRHELALKRLYEVFAGTFKKNEQFWRDLAAEEEKHAQWLSKLKTYPNVASWLQRNIKIKPQAIKMSTEYVEEQIEKAGQKSFSGIQALSVVRDIESALLERQFFKLKDTAPKELSKIMDRLAQETERHLKIVTDKFFSEKQKS